MKKAVIIVAGGSGSRMNSAVPKQFLLLNGLPILMHTMNRFFEFDQSIPLIIVIPSNQTGMWEKLVDKHSFNVPHLAVSGGENRTQSVLSGLKHVNDHCIVAIHDGVRPLCTQDLIRRCFNEATKHSNAIPSIAVSETVREIEPHSHKIDRDNLRLIQTPQCFDSDLLKKAYEISKKSFTDDAQAFENAGNKIHLVEGEKSNIKITDPTDLLIAEALHKKLFK